MPAMGVSADWSYLLMVLRSPHGAAFYFKSTQLGNVYPTERLFLQQTSAEENI